MLPILLLTRPRAQSEALAARLAAEGARFEPLIAPLSEIVPLEWDRRLAKGIRGVIFTSANALPFAGDLAGLPAYCVGGPTAKTAEVAGFDAIASGGDAVALLADLRARRPAGPLLHLHGRHIARDLAEALAPEGFEIRSAAVYAAEALDWPAGLTEALRGREVVAPLYSPRAAALFAARWPEGQAVEPVAISPAAAAKLAPALRARAVIAPHPEAMPAALRALLPCQP